MITVNGDVIINYLPDNISDDDERSIKTIRGSKALKTFRKTVKSRDGHCQCCGNGDKEIEVHHIMPLAKYKDLACNTDNGICLCHDCHEKYHKEYEDNINAYTFSLFMLRFGNRRFV